ncbi:RNA polymerase sigma-70 factor [candidate division KSB1 bacterium]|nr:RNA polymerase sigma-70 factor [candidate division KSB1 bacterium]
MESSPDNLLQQLAAGDERAYETLFKTYYSQLTVFARKYVDDMDVAKEIVQDFFVNLYEKHGSLNITTSIKAYLYTSVHNRCLNYLKHVKTRDEHHARIQQEADTHIDLHDTIAQTELEYFIFQAIKELPPQCQKIFTMSRIDGMTNQQIADQLNISKRTVETHISKAIKILKVKLVDHLSLLMHFLY